MAIPLHIRIQQRITSSRYVHWHYVGAWMMAWKNIHSSLPSTTAPLPVHKGHRLRRSMQLVSKNITRSTRKSICWGKTLCKNVEAKKVESAASQMAAHFVHAIPVASVVVCRLSIFHYLSTRPHKTQNSTLGVASNATELIHPPIDLNSH